MTFEKRGRYFTIEGKRYEWRVVGSLCGLYEIREQEEEEHEEQEHAESD